MRLKKVSNGAIIWF